MSPQAYQLIQKILILMHLSNITLPIKQLKFCSFLIAIVTGLSA